MSITEIFNNISIDTILNDFSHFNIGKIFRSAIILGVAIDIIGAIPIILSLKNKGLQYNYNQVSLYSCIMLFAFLFIGEPLLGWFGVDISSFGVAGGIVLFVMSVEMIFGITIFKEDGPTTNATIVPLVFPLFAGAASFTTLLTLRSQGEAMINLSIAVIINIIFIYFVLRFIRIIEKKLGDGGIYVLRKFFGVMLLAISVKFITTNLIDVIATVRHGIEQTITNMP